MSWREQAACLGADPAIFFPGTGYVGGTTRSEIEGKQRAIETCRTCRVSAECTFEGMKARNHFGIWGGLTVHQRKTLRHRLECVA